MRRGSGIRLGRSPDGKGSDAEPLEGDRGRRRSVEGPDAGQHLIEHDAERIEIGARADVLLDLLRARVLGRPDHPAGRDARIGRGTRDPEIRDTDMIVGVDQDVRGLDVAVDDVVLVGEGEGERRLDPDANREADREWAGSLEDLLEIKTIDELHDDVVTTRLGSIPVSKIVTMLGW